MKILPCPFCGSHEVSISHSTDMDGTPASRFVECHKCAAMGPETEPHRGNAVSKWNNRAALTPPLPAPADRGELREVVERLVGTARPGERMLCELLLEAIAPFLATPASSPVSAGEPSAWYRLSEKVSRAVKKAGELQEHPDDTANGIIEDVRAFLAALATPTPSPGPTDSEKMLQTFAQIVWDARWGKGESDEHSAKLDEMVGIAAEIRSGNFDSLRAAMQSSRAGEGEGRA